MVIQVITGIHILIGIIILLTTGRIIIPTIVRIIHIVPITTITTIIIVIIIHHIIIIENIRIILFNMVEDIHLQVIQIHNIEVPVQVGIQDCLMEVVLQMRSQ